MSIYRPKNAFDTIDHSTLIKNRILWYKRNSITLHGLSHTEIIGKKQYINFDGVNSSLLKIACGLPVFNSWPKVVYVIYK